MTVGNHLSTVLFLLPYLSSDYSTCILPANRHRVFGFIVYQVIVQPVFHQQIDIVYLGL
jgi:hypothetical protein